MAAYTPRERVVATVALSLAVLAQLHAVALANFRAPEFAQLFAGLGGELPFVTRFFFATHRLWWLAPLVSGYLSFDVLGRRDPSMKYFAGVLVATVALAVALYTWLVEAMYAPLFGILDKIG